MASFSLLDAAAPYLKRYYSNERVYSMVYKNRPLYAWFPKKTGVTGENGGYRVPLTIDDVPGESGDFGKAVAARDGNSAEVWALTRVKRYATATLDWETVRAMSNDVGAFMRATTPLINSAINQLANSTAWALFRDGTGVRGRISAVTAGAGGTVTLTSAEDARSFGLRRSVVAVDGAGAYSVAPRGGSTAPDTGKVTAINTDTGVITFDTVPASWSTAADDYLFMLGDTQNGGTVKKVIDGLQAWGPDPTTVTAGQIFNGVERAKYKAKLLCQFPTTIVASLATAGVLTNGIRTAAAALQANEGAPDALFVNPDVWARIESDLSSQSRYEMMMGSDARTGFDSIVINAGGGKINVVADPWCPRARGFLLQRDTWEMFSIDRFPDFVSDDGQRFARIMDADEVEFRLGGYYNTVCRAPGHNSVLRFSF
jgi:hypothetical protein